MNKIVTHHYDVFHALAFADKPRKEWPLWIRVYWWYLLTFVWLHQRIVHKNWQNPFKE
jgi:hypothetical protein